MKPTPTAIIRYAVATATAVSGYVHADLYVHGYRYLHWIGPRDCAVGRGGRDSGGDSA
jgi:hypothetical protein